MPSSTAAMVTNALGAVFTVIVCFTFDLDFAAIFTVTGK